MSTVTVAANNLAEAGRLLNNHFHAGKFAGVKTTTSGGVLRVKMPVSRLVDYKFDASGGRCSWSNSNSTIVLELRDISIEQAVKKDTFHVIFRREHPARQGSSPKDIFLARSLRAVEKLTALDDSALARAARQPDDVSVLLSALSAEEALTIGNEPLAGARLRGIEAKRHMLAEEGGALTAAEAADFLQVSRQAIDKRRKEGKLLALELGKKGYWYPAWQFGLKGFPQVLAELSNHNEWEKLNFFLNPSEALSDRTPLEVLRKTPHELQDVLNAAAAYGEQG